MTATITINGTKENLATVSENWIIKQIKLRQDDGQIVCVIVEISDGSINISLSTGGCPSLGGGGRLPRPDERVFLEKWAEFGLNSSEVNWGHLIAFLKKFHLMR